MTDDLFVVGRCILTTVCWHELFLRIIWWDWIVEKWESLMRGMQWRTVIYFVNERLNPSPLYFSWDLKLFLLWCYVSYFFKHTSTHVGQASHNFSLMRLLTSLFCTCVDWCCKFYSITFHKNPIIFCFRFRFCTVARVQCRKSWVDGCFRQQPSWVKI